MQSDNGRVRRTLLAFLSLLLGCHADEARFIFPRVSDPSVSDFFNRTIYNNDSMVVQWSDLPDTPAINLGLECYDSIQEAIGNATSNPAGYGDGPYDNTGVLRYTFDVSPYYFEETSEKYCQFALYNSTINSCSWGPWGVVTQDVSNHIGFLYSPVFKLLPWDENKNISLWINGQDPDPEKLANRTEPSTIDVTCPTEGIPAASPDMTTTMDYWPSMKDGLAFPTQTYHYDS